MTMGELPKPVGMPIHFDLDLHLKAVNQMILADEVAEAIHMLTDGLPGYYRENPDPRATDMLKTLRRQLVTPIWYANQVTEYDFEMAKQVFDCCYPRAHVTLEEVLKLNGQGIVPTVVDLAPGCFFLAIGMHERGALFKYMPVTFNHVALGKFKEAYGDKFSIVDEPSEHTIFCAFEIIEHLWNPDEIVQHVEQLKHKPKMIIISTPLYTFGFPVTDWQHANLGHLRTYSRQEITNYGLKHWPEYHWAIYPEEVMVIAGRLKEKTT